MTKVVQKLANLVEFKTKEPFMTALNPFIVGNMDKMKDFVTELSVSYMCSYRQARGKLLFFHYAECESNAQECTNISRPS